MGKILAKQIEGSVDLNSDQTIEGTKTFSAPIVCQKQASSHHMINADGFTYWVQDPENLNEDGNFRIGVEDAQIKIQHCDGVSWITDSK